MTTFATSHTPQRMTPEEFAALPEGPPYYELDNGELVRMPSPTISHQDIVDALKEVMRNHVRDKKLGRVFREVDVYLPDGRIYVPDIGFLQAARLELISPLDGKIHGAPDLVIEVTSQNASRDRISKFQGYFDNGVRWYWIVDSQTLAIEEYEATPAGYLRRGAAEAGTPFVSRCFAELAIDLAALLGITSEDDNDAEATPPNSNAQEKRPS